MPVEATEDVTRPPGLVGGALRDTWASLRSVFGNPALRRIELALAGSMIGDWAYAAAVVVWAYGVGGTRLVGIWIGGALHPHGGRLGDRGVLADRLPRKAVLIGSDAARAVLAVAAAAGWRGCRHSPAAFAACRARTSSTRVLGVGESLAAAYDVVMRRLARA